MKNRNIFLVIFLSLITCGIYILYWLYKTRQEMMRYGAKIPNFWILCAPYLMLIGIVIFGIALQLITMGNETTASDLTEAIFGIVAGIAGLGALLFIIPISLWWFYEYSKAVEFVTKGQLSTGLVYGLAIFLSFVSANFIWPGILQDAFNKVAPPEHPIAPPRQALPPQQNPFQV